MFCDSQIEFVISSATGSLNPPQEIEVSDDVKQCASSCKMHKCLVLLSQLLNIDVLTIIVLLLFSYLATLSESDKLDLYIFIFSNLSQDK